MATHKRFYQQQTVKRLYALSGNQCVFPGGIAHLANSEDASNSHICHIEAANESGQFSNSACAVEQGPTFALVIRCKIMEEPT